MKVASVPRRGEAQLLRCFDMSTIWAMRCRCARRNPNPGMWMYGDTQARLERLAPGVLHADLKACNDYAFAGDVKCPCSSFSASAT